MSNIKVGLFINMITPYGLPMLKALSKRVGTLRIFISTKMEANRNWAVDWTDLDVKVQKNITIARQWKHPQGFSETLYTHFPYSTLWDLFSFRPAVVISTEMGFRTLQVLFYKFLLPRTRLIIWALVSEHSEQNRGKLSFLLRRWLLKHADAVIANGKSGARYLSGFGVSSKIVYFAPYTTDIKPFSSCLYPDNVMRERRLLYIGQLNERKGILPFIISLNQWAKDHSEIKITLDIVGSGPLSKDIQNLSTSENLTLIIHGPVPYQDLPSYYSMKHIFIFPTLADEWGVVVNEAMASGLPILGSRFSQAVEELVEDGVNGFIFSPDNPDEMYWSINRALTIPVETLFEMGKRNKLKIRLHTPESQAEKINEAINFARSS